MTNYVDLEIPPLEVYFDGGRVDLLSLGVTYINLQRITEKVAHDLLAVEGVLAPGWKWASYPQRWFQAEYPQLVQLEMQEAYPGSFGSVLAIATLATLAEPHVVPILQNLAANVIWGIGKSGLRGITGEFSERTQIPYRLRRRQQDPYEIEALLRDSLVVAQRNPNVRAIRYRASQQEVSLDLEFYQRHR
jgi:hypothetical protein